jgi:hypothetical protein
LSVFTEIYSLVDPETIYSSPVSRFFYFILVLPWLRDLSIWSCFKIWKYWQRPMLFLLFCGRLVWLHPPCHPAVFIAAYNLCLKLSSLCVACLCKMTWGGSREPNRKNAGTSWKRCSRGDVRKRGEWRCDNVSPSGIICFLNDASSYDPPL